MAFYHFLRRCLWLTMLQALLVQGAEIYRLRQQSDRYQPQISDSRNTHRARTVATVPQQTSVTQTSAAQYSDAQSSSAPLTSAGGGALISEPPLNEAFVLLTFGSSESVPVQTVINPTGTVQSLPKFTSRMPDTTGTIHTTLEPSEAKSAPVISDHIPSPTSTLRATGPASVPKPLPLTTMVGSNIFEGVIASGLPEAPAKIEEKPDHPLPRIGIGSDTPLQTNKFFSNFFLGGQSDPTYTFPYSITWAKGGGNSGSWGMAVSHIEPHQRVFGQPKFAGAASYFINPVGIQYLAISAKELGKDTSLATDSMTAFSARVHLRPNGQSTPAISFPLVQGMAFVTAQYSGATPVLQTGVFFRTVTRVTTDPKADVTKFNIVLEDGSTWRVYAHKTNGDPLDLKVINNGYAVASGPFHGTLQVCKDPATEGSEAVYDAAAGVYPTGLDLSGTVDEARGTYTFAFKRAGHSHGDLVLFALPHHIESFDDTTKQAVTGLKLQTPTKGLAHAVKADKWTMVEAEMPVGIQFAPWHPDRGSITKLSEKAKAVIRGVAQSEISQNIAAQTNLNSMYFSGKALAKFAQICFVLHDMMDSADRDLAQTGLAQLKSAFEVFSNYQNVYPLVYERGWGGIVSSATYKNGDAGEDFGNTYYNDHHFHYGYHILAAAYIGHMDPSWVAGSRQYVDALVRDVANPSADDKLFPMWRNFDWYHGHSWAHGLFAAADGKDQESSSEDMMHAYALKMWGATTGDGKLAARGNLQLAIITRSLRNYYLYTSDNKVQPDNFIGNKVAGILFENKADHTTYFSPDIEAIQGIHMIPVIAPSALVRSAKFVQEEWDAFFSNGRVDDIQNLWKGIIYANYAIVNGKGAWDFFNGNSFDPTWIDGGASLTWYLTYAAAMGEI